MCVCVSHPPLVSSVVHGVTDADPDPAVGLHGPRWPDLKPSPIYPNNKLSYRAQTSARRLQRHCEVDIARLPPARRPPAS